MCWTASGAYGHLVSSGFKSPSKATYYEGLDTTITTFRIGKVAMRAVSDEESVILQISPKFATVHDHVSFQWSLKIHGTTGRLNGSDDEIDDESESPTDYVAVDLYFVDGPVSQVRRSISMQRGRGCEITDKDRAALSQYIKENIGRVIRVSVLIKMDSKLFDPYTYLDSVSPTPQKSFLTANYNARVNSKVWKRRSRKKSVRDENGKVSRNEKIDFEKKFAEVMDQERNKGKCFECKETDKEDVHDLLANMYFNKIVLPGMEYVEDFVDFLIDAELNDLPVLKRACERYLCGELNTKKDLLTSLLLDLLFLSIVFNLPVMKSMTLSELSTRTEEMTNPEKLLEEEEYKNLDKRVRSLSDRNLIELIEQCVVFKEQRNRVRTILLT
uniref:BTB domain-containing protein n=1 Tax=Heterorhabditis bacteriophora TaxID=37862 RepID=A0A1I7XED5_HETBA